MLTDYAAERVRVLCSDAADLWRHWMNHERREEIVTKLRERGIDFRELAAQAKQPDADPFDLLCHLAFSAPILTRRQCADKLKREDAKFFERFGPEARAVLNEIQGKYTEHGTGRFKVAQRALCPTDLGSWDYT
jgi:type I restriction enzyme R subunit